MNEVSFRTAKEEDREFIKDLSARVFSIYGHYDQILNHWFLQPGVITVVASANEHPVGFAMLLIGAIDDSDPWTGELLAIAITPEHQKKGYGQALLHHVESLALQYHLSAICLHTAHGNLSARSLFGNAGFEIVASREKFYPRGQSALMMVKRLDAGKQAEEK